MGRQSRRRRRRADLDPPDDRHARGIAEAEKRGLTVITNHRAVMYNKPGFVSGHAIHRGIWKLLGKY